MSKFLGQRPLILASTSQIRKQLLHSLGIEFSVVTSSCDEEAIKNSFPSEDFIALGLALAAAKALEVSQRYPEHFVIGADQLCLLAKTLFNKPLNRHTAIQQLTTLNGQSHQQISCLCIAKNNKILWQHHEIASLTLRHLSQEAIEAYVSAEQPYHSCGAYHFEGQGKWLFSEVKGTEDTILGLPLIPLADALLHIGAVHFHQ